MNERTLIGPKTYQKERIKLKIISVGGGYRDLAIRIKGFQYKSCQLRIHSLKNLRFTTLSCKEIPFEKSEFATKTYDSFLFIF